MPFCPSCKAEYQAGLSVCPTCQTKLVPELEEVGTSEDMLDVFVCYDAQLAERVLDMLRGEDLAPLLRDHTSSAFPTTMGTSAARVIAVPAHTAAQARRVLAEAINDGVILAEEGEILPAP